MRKGTKRKASRKDGAAAAQSKKEEEEEEVQNEPSQAVEENHKVPTESQLAASKEDGKIAEPADKSAAAAAAEAAVEESTKDEPRGKQEKEEVKKKQEPKRRAKRARIEKPQEEPEYFEEKRNLEDLWLQLVPVGTEWEQVDLVYRYKWSFRNLEDAFEEGGELYGKKVYLFECTEPQYISVQGDHKVVVIPVVVAVVSPFPPSDKIGIASVQRESEEIVPMKQMKMDWVPYIPLENRGSQVERLKSTQIFILGCTQRRAGLKHMNEERAKKFQYCLPYFYQPFKEDEDENKTDVPIMFPTEPPVVCEFDWEFDILEEYTDNLIKEDQLPAAQKDAFKDFVKEKVREAKKAKREVKEARKKALEEMSAETKAAYQNIKFYKFYPVSTPDTPNVSSVKSPFINRYYGKAHKVL